MAESVTEFGKLKDHVHAMAHDMESTHSSAKQASDALGNILKTLLAVEVVVKAVNIAATFSPLASAWKDAFSTLGKTAAELKSIHYAELDAAKEQFKRGEINEAQLRRVGAMTQARVPLLNAQLKLEESISEAGAVRLGVLSTTVALTSRLFYLNQNFNDSLIKSNSSLRARYDLFNAGLRVQQETGAAFNTITEAQRALVNYGFQNRSNYHDVLTTVVELRDGLGMSVQEAAQLAVVTERQVKSSFRATADVIAEIVDSTSLAADEVGRLATNLARAMAVIKPGGVQEFPQIVQLVGKYEDALKRFGGQVGQFEQLISRMTKPEGLLSAGVLGITNPEQLLKTAGVDKAIDNFYKYATSQLAGARGFDRMFRLDILAEQFGTTAEQINAMVQAIEDAKKSQTGVITLQQRFEQQMTSTGEGFRRIGSSLMALAQQALYPLVVAINYVAGVVAKFLETILKYRPLAVAAIITIGTGIFAVILQLKKAAVSFYEVALAARFAASQLKAYAESQIASSAAGGIGKAATAAEGAAGGSFFSRLVGGFSSALSPVKTVLMWGFTIVRTALGLLLTPLGLIGAALGSAIVIWSLIKKMQAQAIENTLNTNAKLVEMRQTYFDIAKTHVYAALRSGDSVKATAVIDRVMKDIASRRGAFSDLSERDAVVKQAQFSKELQKLVPLAEYTATQFGKLRVTPAENQAKLKENTDLQQKIADNTKKAVEQAKKLTDEENKQADEQHRQQELRYMRQGGVLGKGVDIYSAGPL